MIDVYFVFFMRFLISTNRCNNPNPISSSVPGSVSLWVAKAHNDLLNADNNLKAEHIPYDTICSHCQQAAEKFLKAYLVERGNTPPHTHDLVLLLERILSTNVEVEELRDDLALLTPYAVEIRYPDDWFQPSAEDAREAREAAEHVFKWLRVALPELFQHSAFARQNEADALLDPINNDSPQNSV